MAAVIEARPNKPSRAAITGCVGMALCVSSEWRTPAQADGDAYWVCRMHAKPPTASHNWPTRWCDGRTCPMPTCSWVGPSWSAPSAPHLARIAKTFCCKGFRARRASVTDLNIDLVLHRFGQDQASAHWTGYGHKLGTEPGADHILAERTGPVPCDQRSLPATEDRPILEALAEDGRTPQSKLAARTGWSVARVGRRIAALEASGALLYDVDVLPERLGHQLSAMLWLTVAPGDIHRIGERIAAHHHIAFAGAIEWIQKPDGDCHLP